MQLQLPIFSTEAKMIAEVVGYYKKDGIIQYIINWMPSMSSDVVKHQLYKRQLSKESGWTLVAEYDSTQ